jgi:hypothetical protein
MAKVPKKNKFCYWYTEFCIISTHRLFFFFIYKCLEHVALVGILTIPVAFFYCHFWTCYRFSILWISQATDIKVSKDWLIFDERTEPLQPSVLQRHRCASYFSTLHSVGIISEYATQFLSKTSPLPSLYSESYFWQ